MTNLIFGKRASLDLTARSKSVFYMYSDGDDDDDDNDDDDKFQAKKQNKKKISNIKIKRSNSNAQHITTNDNKMKLNNATLNTSTTNNNINTPTTTTTTSSRSKFYSQDSNDEAYLQHLMNKDLKNKLKFNDVEFDHFKPTLRGEQYVCSLKSVKCIYTASKFNHKTELIEYDIKGKLILSNFKLKFVPNQQNDSTTNSQTDIATSDVCNYLNCFHNKKNYFKYWTEFDIPLAHIYGVYASNDKNKKLNFSDTYSLQDQKPKEFVIKCKNFLTRSFSFNNENVATDKYEDFFKFFRSLLHFIDRPTITKLCLFALDSTDSNPQASRQSSYSISSQRQKTTPSSSNSNKTYLNDVDLSDDLDSIDNDCMCIVRLTVAVLDNMSTRDRNSILKESTTLPFVVPNGFIKIDINTRKPNTADIFMENRIPIWSFTHPNGASLISISECMPNRQKEADELVKKYNSILCQWKRVKYRTGYVNMDDLYYKIQVPFKYNKLSVSFEKLLEICAYKSTNDFLADDDNWHSRLHNTKWLTYVSRLIETANTIVEHIYEESINVFIEERVNKDLSCVLTSLVNILLFKKYRTIRGFQDLIQKEWFLVGHMFAKRLDLVSNRTGSALLKSSDLDQTSVNSDYYFYDNADGADTSSDYTPVFMIFLDCVWQLCEQYQSEFEFNETYLISLFDYSLSGLAVTFSFNGAHDWLKYSREFQQNNDSYLQYLLDLNWNWSAHLRPTTPPETVLFLNSDYRPTNKSFVLKPYSTLGYLKFWQRCYLRWYNLTNTQIKQCDYENEKLKQHYVANVARSKETTFSSAFYSAEQQKANTNPRPDSYMAAFAGRITNKHEPTRPAPPPPTTPSLNEHGNLPPKCPIRTRRTPDGSIETTI